MNIIEDMSQEMRECVNFAIKFRLANSINRTEDYFDQAQYYSLINNLQLFSAYTPWGVACIEAAFLNRMTRPANWDSKCKIRRDILTNPHLHLNIKTKLLKVFNNNNWEWWYDSFYAHKIIALECMDIELYEEVLCSTYLSESSRENLLYNLKNR